MKVGESVYPKNRDRLTIYDYKKLRHIRGSGFPWTYKTGSVPDRDDRNTVCNGLSSAEINVQP